MPKRPDDTAPDARATQTAPPPRSGLSLLLRPQGKPGEADEAALRPLLKAFAARLAETLAQRFGLRVGFAPDAGPAPGEPGPGLVARIQGEDGFASIEVGQGALYDLIEALFGGDGTASPYRDARAPSELERAVAEGLAPAFALALGHALERDDLCVEKVYVVQERPSGLMRAGLKMRLIGRETRLSLALPPAWIGAAAPPRRSEAPALDALDLDLSVSLPDAPRPLGDLIGLRVGDVLALGVGAAAPVRVDARGGALFEARLGQSAGRYTFRIERRLDGAAACLEEVTR